MGALSFIATGFFNILNLSEKPYSQLLIQHYSETFEKCPAFGSHLICLQCLLHVNTYLQQRKSIQMPRCRPSPTKIFPWKDEALAIFDIYSYLKLHFNIVLIPHAHSLNLGL